jgi:hypothetical protein
MLQLKPGGQLVIVAEANALSWYGPIYKVSMAPMGGRVLSACENHGAFAAPGSSISSCERTESADGWLSDRRSSATAS